MHSSPPSESVLCGTLWTVWYSKNRIQWQNPKWDHGKGRVLNPRVAESSARLRWSSPLPFYFFTPPSFPPFNPVVPPLLTLSLPLSCVYLCPPLSIYLPSLFSPCVGKHKLLYVYHRGVNMWPGRLRGCTITYYIRLQDQVSFALAVSLQANQAI